MWWSEGEPHMVLIAGMAIKNRQELTFDYKWCYVKDADDCLCFSPHCTVKIQNSPVSTVSTVPSNNQFRANVKQIMTHQSSQSNQIVSKFMTKVTRQNSTQNGP